MVASIQKKDKELVRKAKAQQKRQRKLERRRTAPKAITEPQRNGIDLAVADSKEGASLAIRVRRRRAAGEIQGA